MNKTRAQLQWLAKWAKDYHINRVHLNESGNVTEIHFAEQAPNVQLVTAPGETESNEPTKPTATDKAFRVMLDGARGEPS
jgi:hypothetical protein